MSTTIPDLPSEGDTSWYDWATGMDSAVREVQATPPSTYTPPAIHELDSFAGADADARLTAALSYVASQTYVPAIRFPAGVTTLNTPGRSPFTGMKLIGPNSYGPKRIDHANAAADHKIILDTGITTGTNALFQSTATIYSVHIAGLAFENAGTAQFWHHPSGQLHSSLFEGLSFKGLKHIVGSSGSAAILTATSFSGSWQVNSFTGSDTQFHLAGTRNSLWTGGLLNIYSTSGAGGVYVIDLNGLASTQIANLGMFISGGWMGIKIRGASDGLTLANVVASGTDATTSAHGNVIRVEGGIVSLRDVYLAYAMSSPSSFSTSSSGVIHVTGGNVLIDRPIYTRATGVAEATPLVYASAGTVEVRNAGAGGSWSGLPRVEAASSAIMTVDVSLTVV